MSLIEGGVHSDQFSIEGGANSRGVFMSTWFSIEGGANRRGVHVLIEGGSGISRMVTLVT